MPFFISQSKVSQWRRCKRAFYNQNILHLKKAVPPRPLKFGTMSHKMLQATAEGEDPFKRLDEIAVVNEKLFREEREAYGQIVDDMAYIHRAYEKFWKDKPLKMVPVKQGKTIYKAEIPFEVEVSRNIVVKGTIDGIVDAKGSKWLLEHKNHTTIPNDDHRWRNLQSTVYIRIVSMLGWTKPLSGTLWNYIRTKSPTRPKLLASGKLSEASIDSLPEVVIDTKKQLIAAGHKRVALQPLTALLDEQEKNLHTWFARYYTPINREVMSTLWQEFIATGREMAAYFVHTDAPPPRSIDLHCSWCPYEALCRAELQGNDVDFVMKHQYKFDDTPYQDADE